MEKKIKDVELAKKFDMSRQTISKYRKTQNKIYAAMVDFFKKEEDIFKQSEKDFTISRHFLYEKIENDICEEILKSHSMQVDCVIRAFKSVDWKINYTILDKVLFKNEYKKSDFLDILSLKQNSKIAKDYREIEANYESKTH